MRDFETMVTGLPAAETGRLVFSTLHTNDASQTIFRILDSFPTSIGRRFASSLPWPAGRGGATTGSWSRWGVLSGG
jgi:hypothetical protein